MSGGRWLLVKSYSSHCILEAVTAGLALSLQASTCRGARSLPRGRPTGQALAPYRRASTLQGTRLPESPLCYCPGGVLGGPDVTPVLPAFPAAGALDGLTRYLWKEWPPGLSETQLGSPGHCSRSHNVTGNLWAPLVTW